MTDVKFTSVFRNEFSDLIALKQASGFKYETESIAFRRLAVSGFTAQKKNLRVMNGKRCSASLA